MSNYQMLTLTIIIIGVVFVGALAVICYKKKGFNTAKILKDVEGGLEEAGIVISSAKSFIPSKALNILEIIDNIALRETKAIEQLTISGQLPIDQRKATAKDNIIETLKAFNIPVNEALEKVIDTAIESCVFDGKSDDEKKCQAQNVFSKQITQLQNEKADAVNKAVNLENDNNQLKQTLSVIQNTAQNIIK